MTFVLSTIFMSKPYVRNGRQRKYNSICKHYALFKKDWSRHVTHDIVNVEINQTFLTFQLYLHMIDYKFIVRTP